MHPFFDELRQEGTTLPNGNPLPELFNFTKEELMQMENINKEGNSGASLVPEWYRARQEQREKLGNYD